MKLSRRARKSLILHVGTHKTATTSLQATFAASSAALAARGTLYPETGRVLDAHHNIAWGLVGDQRFDPARGYLDELAEEIRRERPSRVLLSSEDMEYLHHRGDRLSLLRRWARRLGYEPVAILVLRDVQSYVESLFAELARHGLTQEFDDFARAALAARCVTFRALWKFQLDYEALAAGFAGAFGPGALVVVPYDPHDMVGCFLRHFPMLMGDAEGIEATLAVGRLNPRNSVDETVRLLALNRAAEGRLQEGGRTEERHRLSPPLRGQFAAVADGQIERLLERYPAKNLR